MGVRSTAMLFGALAIGIVLACDPDGWSPFGPAKWLVVSTFGPVLVAVGVRDARPGGVERTLLACFAALVLVATVVAVEQPRYAWLGTPERRFGACTWILVVGSYLAGRSLASPSPVASAAVIARAGAVGGVVIGLWSSVELVGGQLIELSSSTERLTGPFGSAAYLGAASLLFGGLAGGVAVGSGERRRWRAIGAVGALGCTVALVGSGSRAALVGAVAGALIVLPRRGLVVVAALLVAAAVAFAPRWDALLERPGGSTSRVAEWEVAARVIARHPLLGVGPEGYRLVVAEGVDDDYERRHGRDVLPDRAHSGPLDVAVTLGLPAAAVWVVGVGAVVLAGRRVGRRSRLLGGVAFGLVAYLCGQALFFPIVELDVLAAGLAGLMVGASAQLRTSPCTESRDEAAMSTPGWPIVRERRPGTVVVGIVAGCLTLIALVSGVRTVAADRFAGARQRCRRRRRSGGTAPSRPARRRTRRWSAALPAVARPRRGSCGDVGRRRTSHSHDRPGAVDLAGRSDRAQRTRSARIAPCPDHRHTGRPRCRLRTLAGTRRRRPASRCLAARARAGSSGRRRHHPGRAVAAPRRRAPANPRPPASSPNSA